MIIYQLQQAVTFPTRGNKQYVRLVFYPSYTSKLYGNEITLNFSEKAMKC